MKDVQQLNKKLNFANIGDLKKAQKHSRGKSKRSVSKKSKARRVSENGPVVLDLDDLKAEGENIDQFVSDQKTIQIYNLGTSSKKLLGAALSGSKHGSRLMDSIDDNDGANGDEYSDQEEGFDDKTFSQMLEKQENEASKVEQILAVQTEITMVARAILIDWMICVC